MLEDDLLSMVQRLKHNLFDVFVTYKPSVKPIDIIRVERIIGFILPDVLKAVLQHMNGYTVVTANETIGRLMQLLSVKDIALYKEKLPDIISETDSPLIWLDTYVPIGKSLNATEYVCIDYSTDATRVIQLNLNTGEITAIWDDLGIALCDMFTTVIGISLAKTAHTADDVYTEKVVNSMMPAMESYSDGMVGILTGNESRKDKDKPLKDIKAVMDKHLGDKTIDKRLVKRILHVVSEFETRSEAHIAFLGTNLLGQYRTTYIGEDAATWMDTVLDVDDCNAFESDYHNLPTVNKEFFVTGSVLNMSFVYMAYRIGTSDLPNKIKTEAGVAIFKMLHYKYISSLMYRNFRFKTQEDIALALYEGLSYKNLLKRYGSFGALITARAEDVISSKSVHQRTLMTMRDDKACLYVLSDTQTRIRSVVNLLRDEYLRLRDLDTRISGRGLYITTEEGKELKDVIVNADMMRSTMDLSLVEASDFIRSEVLDYTLRIVPSATADNVQTVLQYYVDMHKRDKRIIDTIETMVVYLTTVGKSRDLAGMNTPDIIAKVRSMCRSSQLKNPHIKHIKKKVTDIVDDVLDDATSKIKAGTVIGVIIYIAIRTIAYKHYS